MNTTTTSYIQQPSYHPAFLSYTPNESTFYNPANLNFSTQKRRISDDDDNQSIDIAPRKKRSRTIPAEEKDKNYYEKRARNNLSAKRSRDLRRIREQEIQERVIYLCNENARLRSENEGMQYELARLSAIYNGISKSLQ